MGKMIKRILTGVAMTIFLSFIISLVVVSNRMQPMPVAIKPKLTALDEKAKDERFEACRSKLIISQKLDVLYNLEWKRGDIPPKITVGPTFYTMSFDAKEAFAETVNCFCVAGAEDAFINFDLFDSMTGKKVARYSYGKLKMN